MAIGSHGKGNCARPTCDTGQVLCDAHERDPPAWLAFS